MAAKSCNYKIKGPISQSNPEVSSTSSQIEGKLKERWISLEKRYQIFDELR